MPLFSKTFSLSSPRRQFPTASSTHTKNVAAAVRPEAPRPRASEGKAASETGGWRGMIACFFFRVFFFGRGSFASVFRVSPESRKFRCAATEWILKRAAVGAVAASDSTQASGSSRSRKRDRRFDGDHNFSSSSSTKEAAFFLLMLVPWRWTSC